MGTLLYLVVAIIVAALLYWLVLALGLPYLLGVVVAAVVIIGALVSATRGERL